MGREALVTHEQVAAAADAMMATGLKPTSRAIRERVGNVGSLGTINKMLQQWKAGQAHQAASAIVLPPTLQRTILEFMAQELAVARAVLEGELVHQQQETNDLATENERQARAIEDKAEQLDAIAADKAAAQGRTAQLEADLEAAKGDAERVRQGAEHARTELAKAQLRLEAVPRLEQDLAAIQTALERERQARTDAQQAAAVLAAQMADLDARVAETRARAQRLEDQLAKTREKSETLAAELADARVAAEAGHARIKLQEHDIAESKKEADRARAEARTAGEQVAERRARLAPQRH